MLLSEDIKHRLSRQYQDRVSFDEPMSRHTSFRVGGPADVFVCPRNTDDAMALIDLARSEGLPLLVIGDGTNLIVRDGGIEGLVISLSAMDGEVRCEEKEDGRVIIHAHAGVRTKDLCKLAWEKGYAGLNFALGIPGTLGGNIAMNAGTHLGAMEQILAGLDIVNGNGRLKTVNREDLNFSYRHLEWPESMGSPVILSATLTLAKGDAVQLEAEARALLKTRTQNQPVSLPNAGCIFKNPDGADPAGKLIDTAGLKGLAVGGARISERHANFIVNENNARAADILALIDTVQNRVFAHVGVTLETEVKIVGKN